MKCTLVNSRLNIVTYIQKFMCSFRKIYGLVRSCVDFCTMLEGTSWQWTLTGIFFFKFIWNYTMSNNEHGGRRFPFDFELNWFMCPLFIIRNVLFDLVINLYVFHINPFMYNVISVKMYLIPMGNRTRSLKYQSIKKKLNNALYTVLKMLYMVCDIYKETKFLSFVFSLLCWILGTLHNITWSWLPLLNKHFC